MKREKISSIIIIIIFIFLCLINIIWRVVYPYADTTNYENRELHSRPKLGRSNYKSFATQYTDYYNDNIPFRNYLISLDSSIDYYLFHKSSRDYVCIGDDNWLFYSRTDDGNPIGCYQGTNLCTEDELSLLLDNCLLQRDILAANGSEFIIFVAPNKERIYSQYMPDRYGQPAEQYRAKQVVDYLRAHSDLTVIYPYDELISATKNIPSNIYYKTDTHWNEIGGYIGSTTLLDALGIKIPNIYDNRIKITNDSYHRGDLASMLNMANQLNKYDPEYIINGYDTHSITTVSEDFFNMYEYHAINADPRTIYVYRDSFATAMSKYIGSQFTNTYMRYNGTYSYSDYLNYQPDIFVYETVERYISDLITFDVTYQ